MSSGELIQTSPTESILHGEVLETDKDYLQAVYSSGGIEDDLVRYLDTGSAINSEIIDLKLSQFSNIIARAAWKHDEIDVAVVRSGFDIVTESMNKAANQVHGYARQGALQSLLVRAGIKPPQIDSYVRALDDRYWSRQFMEEFKKGGPLLPSRHVGETDSDYFARYTYGCMRGFLFARFTHLAKY